MDRLDWSSILCRYKKTIICQEVAKAKNVCQVCLLDLDYNIPVQARDAALGVEDEVFPDSDVGKEYRLKQLENAGTLDSSYLKACSGIPHLMSDITLPKPSSSLHVVCPWASPWSLLFGMLSLRSAE
jgi:pre-mRNA-splicing factor RBM22/SLT11